MSAHDHTLIASEPLSSELGALLRLLDDPDDEIIAVVQSRLLAAGEIILPYLYPLTVSEDPLLRTRAVYIAGEIASVRPLREFASLAVSAERSPVNDISLAAGCLALTRLAYPAYTAMDFDDALARLAQGLALRVDRCTNDAARLHAITRFFYEEQLFAGNTDDYYHPDNSMINRVLETRRGLPISIAVVIILVARRLGIPMQGVNMPAHFMVRYAGSQGEAFLDPFTGRLLTRVECTRLLERAGIEDIDGALARPTDRQIIGRMINNAINAYERGKDPVRAAVLRRCGELLREPLAG